METVFEILVFGEMWEQFDSHQVTESIWDAEQLPGKVRGDLERYGIQDFGLMFFTSVGWTRRGGERTSLAVENKAVKQIQSAYQRLGLEPKYSKLDFGKPRSHGSLWD